MPAYLLRAFYHRRARGSTPQIVISNHALVNPKYYVGWSPANTAIAIGTSPNPSLRDLATGEMLRQWKGGPQMAWSPDGSALLTHCLPDVRRLGEWTFQIRDAQTGELRCTYDAFCGGHVYALAWSPDGTRIAHSTDQDREGRVYLWDARSGTPLLEYRGHSQSPCLDRLSWSPDSTLLLSSDNNIPHEGTTRLWQSADGKTLRQVPSLEIWANSPGRSRVQAMSHAIAAIKASSPTPLLNFWDAFTQQCQTNTRDLGLLLNGAWSPDGQHLALIDGDMVVLLNWHTGEQERVYGGHLRDKPYLVPPKTQYGPCSLSWSQAPTIEWK